MCIDFSETCSCPTHSFVMHGGTENNLAQIIIMMRQCAAIKNHITRLKVKVTVALKLCAYASMKPVYVRRII